MNRIDQIREILDDIEKDYERGMLGFHLPAVRARKRLVEVKKLALNARAELLQEDKKKRERNRGTKS